MTRVNIFTRYTLPENAYTNGFVSLLDLARLGTPLLLETLLNERLALSGTFHLDDFRVLRGVEGYADAEVCGSDFSILFETKIVSGALREDQVRAHLRVLNGKPQARRYLVLLTPDDEKSAYIKRYLSMDPRIRHLEWRVVYDLFDLSPEMAAETVFSALAGQFRDHIQKTVFEEDIAGCILRISFGARSEVYPDRYLDELKDGKLETWDTPRFYKSLDGKGRKLLLYDHTRKGITAEAEVREVSKNGKDPGYPWENRLVSEGVRIFDPPISLECIRLLEGLDRFGVGQNPINNITREQYHWLLELYQERTFGAATFS